MNRFVPPSNFQALGFATRKSNGATQQARRTKNSNVRGLDQIAKKSTVKL
jgi:hypothetical protein